MHLQCDDLQQKEGGTVASLDETLGAANLHLSCIEREKRAAAVAAKQATEARKAALVEASWCRILKAAGWVLPSFNMKVTFSSKLQYFFSFPCQDSPI